MLNFVSLEKHFQLLGIINQYQQLLFKYDSNLRTARLDGMPRSGNYHADAMGELLIRKEQARAKIQRLQGLADEQAPEVANTIKAACSGGGRAAVKAELAMMMRYQRGDSWDMICDVLHEPSPQQIRSLIISRLERARQKDGIDTGTAGGAV